MAEPSSTPSGGPSSVNSSRRLRAVSRTARHVMGPDGKVRAVYIDIPRHYPWQFALRSRTRAFVREMLAGVPASAEVTITRGGAR